METSPEEFIQGVGNEVLYFFLVMSCLVVVVGAWFSTQVVEPVVSSVILVERTRIEPGIETSEVDGLREEEYFQTPPDPPESSSPSDLPSDLQLSPTPHQSSAPQQTQTSNLPGESHSPDVTENIASGSQPAEVAEPFSLPQEERVTVRLRFLNETQREVEASLIENIGNFKRRNFSVELSENKNIRLIFNGQVLRDEESTLRRCGIFDKCVVHCLVQQQSNTTNTTNNQTNVVQENPEDFDLSELFIPILGVALIILWYFAFTYSTYFNTMSSTALLGLTSLFLFSVYGTNFHVNVAVRAR